MLTPITIPKATISMEEGTIVRRLKVEGEAIAKDDLLFEMETDKAVMEVPSPAQGILNLSPKGPRKNKFTIAG